MESTKLSTSPSPARRRPYAARRLSVSWTTTWRSRRRRVRRLRRQQRRLVRRSAGRPQRRRLVHDVDHPRVGTGGPYPIVIGYRPVAGSGAWTVFGYSAGTFSVESTKLSTITVTGATGGHPQHDGVSVSWTTDQPVASGGQFGVWVEGTAGWYVGQLVASNGGDSYSTSITLDVPTGESLLLDRHRCHWPGAAPGPSSGGARRRSAWSPRSSAPSPSPARPAAIRSTTACRSAGRRTSRSPAAASSASGSRAPRAGTSVSWSPATAATRTRRPDHPRRAHRRSLLDRRRLPARGRERRLDHLRVEPGDVQRGVN